MEVAAGLSVCGSGTRFCMLRGNRGEMLRGPIEMVTGPSTELLGKFNVKRGFSIPLFPLTYYSHRSSHF